MHARVYGCVCEHMYVWGEGGGVKRRPTGRTQRDLNSSIMSESQAAAMSPDCRVPAELSLFPPRTHFFFCLPLLSSYRSLFFFLAVGIAVD